MQGDDLVPLRRARKLGLADADDVAGNLDAQLPEQQLGEGSRGDAGGAFAGAGALEHVAGILEVVLEGTGEIGVAGPRRGDGLVLGRIAFFDRQNLGPVLPVVVGQRHGDGRADGLAVANAAEDVRRVALDAHTAAAAIALLAAPQLAVHKLKIDGNACRHSADHGHETLAVALSCCRKSKHFPHLTGAKAHQRRRF